MTVHTFDRHQVGRKYHVEHPTPKHVENSERGIKHAKHIGCKTIDLDMTPDGVLTRAAHSHVIPLASIEHHIRNNHWPDPFRHDGFRDPKHILGKGDHIQSMEPHEIDRLVAGHWPRRYHIQTIETQLALCAKVGIQALIEPKQSAVWLHPEVWNYLASVAEKHRTRTAVYSLMHECLPYARHAGFTAWPIGH